MKPYRLPENPNLDDYKNILEYYKTNRNKYKNISIFSCILFFISIGIITILVGEKKKEFSLIERLSDQKNCISFEKVSIPVMVPKFVERVNEESKYYQFEDEPCRDQTALSIGGFNGHRFCPHPKQLMINRDECICQTKKY